MEPNPGSGTGPNPHHRATVVQLICRAYGLSDASEITMEHIDRYVTERRRADENTRRRFRDRVRPTIPRQRSAGDAA